VLEERCPRVNEEPVLLAVDAGAQPTMAAAATEEPATERNARPGSSSMSLPLYRLPYTLRVRGQAEEIDWRPGASG